jgi:hypothetical protein
VFETSRAVLIGVLRPNGRRLLSVRTFGGLLRAMQAEAVKAAEARQIVEERAAHVLALRPDQIGDAVYLGEALAELDVLAQAHAVEIDDLSLPRIDVETGSGYSADVIERLYLPAKRFGIILEGTEATLVAILARLFAVRPRSIRVVAELFGPSLECADVTLAAIWARLFVVRAIRSRPRVKFVHPSETVLAILVLMVFVHL